MTTAAYEAQSVWADESFFARLRDRIERMAVAVRRRQARREALRRLSAIDAHTLDDLGLNRADVNAIIVGAGRFEAR